MTEYKLAMESINQFLHLEQHNTTTTNNNSMMVSGSLHSVICWRLVLLDELGKQAFNAHDYASQYSYYHIDLQDGLTDSRRTISSNAP